MIKYLGRIIDKDGIKADTSHFPSQTEYQRPTTIKKFQPLIGMINWFRNYVPDLSHDLHDIKEKLKTKVVTIKWKEDEKAAVIKIFNQITNQTIIHHIESGKPFTLQTDASDYGISAIFYQKKNLLVYIVRSLALQKRITQLWKKNA
ncbi:putative LTR transposon [Pseudoloma neurophilia]|uniref:Putative LTR transposon n=1 Tax=Pseudoloma neurophilia TaxID=146866 RepID=A0A0R0M3P5_9MICR|nr:putative LTR transposon [Pseudoloma neurophilia]